MKTDSVNLSDVQVNATRNKLYSEMGRVLTVINKDEIKRSAVQSIDQLLDYVSGIDIRQRGTNGTQADISVRGGSFDQVLVLLNGINITDPQTGHFNLDIPLNLSDVSRVEILEGSSARVLGPNAFSGAINIVTENNGKPFLNAELVGGSFNSFGESVSGNLGKEKFHTFASVSHNSSTGYMANTDYDLSSAFAQSVLNTKNAGKFDLQLATQLKAFGANGFYALAFPNQYENSKTFLAAVDWSMNRGKFTFTAQAYWRRHDDKFELFRDFIGAPSWYTSHNYHMTDVTGGKATVSYLSDLGKTTVGVDIRNEHIFSNVLGNPMAQQMAIPFETNQFFTHQANRLLETGFIDQTFNLNRWYFSVGGAGTSSTSFGLYGYGGADIAYAFSENVRVFADANSAVRLPTFTDLYYNSATQISNPNLKPEKSQTVEVGTKIQKTNWKLDVSLYKRFGQDVIDWIKQPDSTKWQSRNLTNVDAIGADFAFEYYFRHSFLNKVSTTYSYLSMDKSATGFDSKYALDYLKNKVTLAIQHKIWNNLAASWTGSYSDRAGQYTSLTNKLVNYTPYFMLNGRLLWMQKLYEIYADVNNILNTTYADFGGLIQPGINFNVGVRLKL
ncbi:MAG: TonB-dependent receptor [Paludibacter sp.]|nr:TonB-dependent receptor [Paludibacter sp.]